MKPYTPYQWPGGKVIIDSVVRRCVFMVDSCWMLLPLSMQTESAKIEFLSLRFVFHVERKEAMYPLDSAKPAPSTRTTEGGCYFHRFPTLPYNPLAPKQHRSKLLLTILHGVKTDNNKTPGKQTERGDRDTDRGQDGTASNSTISSCLRRR